MRRQLTGALIALAFAGGLGVQAPALAAECDLGDVNGRVNVLGNEFPALQAIMAAAGTCAHGGLTVEDNLTQEHKDIQVAALTANPSEYTGAIVANSSLVPLMNDNLIRPPDAPLAGADHCVGAPAARAHVAPPRGLPRLPRVGREWHDARHPPAVAARLPNAPPAAHVGVNDARLSPVPAAAARRHPTPGAGVPPRPRGAC
mgnify:CR=1 FL=1